MLKMSPSWTFNGRIQSVQSEQKLDVQAESFDVRVTYVNEFREDPDVRYLYMSCWNV